MNLKKNDFLKMLKAELSFLPKFEQNEILDYYEELIQDALDHGEIENEFIDALGSIDTIIYNIKKDGSFLEKVKNHANLSVSDVFDFTVKVIGYFFFFILAITFVSIGFSFVVTGISIFFYAGIQIFVDSDASMNTQLFRVSEIVFGIGFAFVGISLFKWFFQNVKTKLNQLLHRVRDLIRG